ncbi:MAG: hypothetical protein OXB86_02820 [Bdellovibrionales bacterium]|nr:hypothetical protein [Bdellovibrionales bacterium]
MFSDPLPDETELGSCKEAKMSAVSACSTGEVMGTVGTAMLPMVSAASAMGEDDTSEVVETQGQATQAVGAVNVGVGAYCLKKVTSCVSTCTEVSAACKQCDDVKKAATALAPAPECPPTPGADSVTYDPADCDLAEAAITACEELKQSAIAALAQGGILGLVGEMMKRAGKDMKDSTEITGPPPQQPPKAPSSSDNNSPLSVGVAPLHANQGPGQFAPIKTTPGQPQGGAAPPEDPFISEEEEKKPALTPLSSNSGSGSLAGTSSGSPGGGGAPGGPPSGEGDKDGNGKKPLSSQYGGAGGEGFLSGRSSRRGGSGSSSRSGRGYPSGSGKKKSGQDLAKKDKLRAKRSISQTKSRHQSIFEIMSDLIQSFCREGQPVCE